MRVYDYKCIHCGCAEERFVKDSDVHEVECSQCNGIARRELCTPRFALDPNDKAGFPSAYAKWDKHHKNKRANAPVSE